MDDHWVGRMDEKVKHLETEIVIVKTVLEAIRAENNACRVELKGEIHELAKWRERVLVYLVIGGFIAAYAGKHILDLFFKVG